MNVLGVFLDSQKKFLDVGNANSIKAGGTDLGNAFQDFLLGIQSMEKEKDNQEDDLFGFYGRGLYKKDPRFEKQCGEVDVIGCLEFHAKLGNLFQLLNIGFNLKLVPVPISDRLLTGVENIRDNFSGVQGVRISWKRDIATIVAVIANTLIHSGIVQGIFILSAALGGSDPSQYQGILDLLNSDLINPDFLESFLVGLIPDVFEFDMYKYFSNPKSVRSFLPFWTPTTYRTLDANKREYFWVSTTVLYEYECPDNENPLDPPVDPKDATKRTIVCPVSPKDTDHFLPSNTSMVAVTTPEFEFLHREYLASLKLLNSQYGIPKDCVNNSLFYMPIRDPTLGGILYLNLGPLVKSDNVCLQNWFGSTTFKPADNFLLGALVPLLIEQVTGILSGLGG
jgi:hypothetical protein